MKLPIKGGGVHSQIEDLLRNNWFPGTGLSSVGRAFDCSSLLISNCHLFDSGSPEFNNKIDCLLLNTKQE